MLSAIYDKIKSRQTDIFLGICIILISIISYNLGKINALEKTPLRVGESANIYKAVAGQQTSPAKEALDEKQAAVVSRDTRVVVSKKASSKTYHYIWCSGAKMMKEENKAWFDSAEEAQKAGYTLAGNCRP